MRSARPFHVACFGLAAVAGAAACLAPRSFADTEHCPPKTGPTQLVLVEKDFGAIDHYVELNWAAWAPGPSYDTEHYTFVRWEVQRSVDGGLFAELAPADPAFGVNPNSSVGYALNYIRPPADCQGSCAMPGGTYSYRVRAHYQYAAICDEFDGATYTTGFSNEASITVSGDGGGGGEDDPPTNLIAVAHEKQRRVDLHWTAPQERPDSYRILRRRLSGPGKAPFRAAPADGGDYEEVATVDGRSTSYKDRNLRDFDDAQIYGYCLEALREAGAAAAKGENLAYLLAKTNRKSEFREPQSRFVGSGPDGIAELKTFDGTRRFELCAARSQAEDLGLICFGGTLGSLDGRALPRESDATVEMAGQSAGELAARPDWAKSLTVGAKAELKLTYAKPGKLGAFEPLAFRRLNATLRVPRPGDRSDEKVHFTLDQNDEGVLAVPTIRLYATAAPGKSLARDRDKVIVLYQIVCLGPVALYSERVRLTATVTNGVILGGIGAEHFQLAGDVAVDGQGRSVATFDVGAIGPTASDRSQVATLLLQVRCASAGTGQHSETEVQFSYAHGNSWNENENVEWDLAERTVEIAVERRKTPAKR